MPRFNLGDLTTALLGLFLLAIPLASVGISALGGHDLARLAQLGLLPACAAVAVCTARAASGCGFSRRHVALLAALAVLVLGSVARAAEPAMAAREAALFIGLSALALQLRTLARADTALALLTSGASLLYVSVVLLLVLADTLTGAPVARLSLFIGYDNHRFYNHVQTAALPLALVSMAPRLPRPTRLLARTTLIGGMALLLASGGRGTALALVAAALAMAAIGGRDAVPLLRALVMAALVAAALFVLLFIAWPALHGDAGASVAGFADYSPARLASDQARLSLWQPAWALIQKSPWFGEGPMHYARLPLLKGAHPHNIYLQIGAEWGLPMLALLLGAAVALLWRLARAVRATADAHRRWLGLGLAGAWVAVLCDGLVSGNFVMPVSQVWIAVTAGWALAWLWAQPPATPAPAAVLAPPWRARALLAAVLALQLWLVADVWPEATRLRAHLEGLHRAFPGQPENPRFWSIGRF